MSSRLIVRGWWHPPPVTDPTYPGWLLRTDEVGDVSRRFKNKPVYVEHNDARAVGKVDRIWMDNKTKALAVDLAIDTDNAGVDVVRRIKSGELKGLSFGSHVFKDAKFNRTSEHDPKEISIVEKGDIAGTHIFAFTIDDKVFVSPQHSVYLANSFRKPTRTMTEPIAQADQTPVAIPSDVSPETIMKALKVYEEHKLREAEKEKAENERIESLVEDKIHKKWEAAVLAKKIEFDPHFGAGVINNMGTAEGRALLTCLASALDGNFSSLETQRIQIAEQSKQGLATPEERKQPVAANKFVGIFSKPVAPAEPEHTPVEMKNSAKKREVNNGMFANPEKRAKVAAMMENELRNAPKN